MSITYDKLFRITRGNVIIFFEDDFEFEENKDILFYGLSRLNYCNHRRLFEELKDAKFIEQLKQFVNIVSKYVNRINWDGVLKNKIGTLFQCIEDLEGESGNIIKSLRTIYETIDLRELLCFKSVFHQYGIGAQIPNYFSQIFHDFIEKDGEWKPYKIYTNFNQKIKNYFQKDLDEYSQSQGTIICIIDNQLKSEPRADEILKELENFNEKKRENIIAAILSSHDKEEKINSKIFAEFVSKNEASNKLQIALANSAYSLLLFKLKKLYQDVLEKAFDEAIVNKNIANYFANMASYEGVTNYKVVTDWINLLFRYQIYINDEIFDIIKLTQLMDIMNDEEITYSCDMQKINTFEAFDFNVNRYYQPPAAGDIFKDNKGNYYVLVGQDCDLMTGPFRKENAIVELVQAFTTDQEDIEKQKDNLEYMYVNNFTQCDSGKPQALKIKYSSRKFLDNAIIKLCCFNNEGKCQINLNKELDVDIQDLITPYFTEVYSELQQYFLNINDLKNTCREKIGMFLESKFSPRLTSIIQYENLKDNCIVFPYKRIGRLNRNYVLYLYKLFLEYRGRHPFDSINLTRHVSVTVPVINSSLKLPIEVVLSTDREANRKECYKRLRWSIYSADIERVVKEMHNEDIHIKETGSIVLKETNNVIKCESGRILKIMKTKKGVQISVGSCKENSQD